MNHLLLSISLPFLIAVIIYVARRARASMKLLILTPLTMFLFGLWSVVPDIPRLLGKQDLYYTLALNPKIDIFFWHYTIDKIETDSPVYLVAIVLVCLSILYVAWRELYILEQTEHDRSSSVD